MSLPKPFQFKEFSVEHHRSPMPIGTDSVLLGSWVSLSDDNNILDVGTGCGLIALMCAQRTKQSSVTGIDISKNAIEEASKNGIKSSWYSRLNFIHTSLKEYKPTRPFDVIISNPPYFEAAGLQSPNNARANARHANKMSTADILSFTKNHLSSKGKLALVLPYSSMNSLKVKTENQGFHFQRILKIRPKANKEYNRFLVEIGQKRAQLIENELFIRDENGLHSQEYAYLTSEFYL